MAPPHSASATANSIHDFQAGGTSIRLSATDIHVWLIDLDAACDGLVQVDGALSESERVRARRIRSDQQARRWACSRVILRQTLAAYSCIAARELRFRPGRNDKPELDDAGAPAPLHFNLSHSERYALLGVTRCRAIGIDIEAVRPMSDLIAVASRFFAPREQACLNSVGGETQTAAFFECWTRKEAVLKATGEGIGAALEKLCVTFGDGQPPRVLEYNGSTSQALNWTLVSLELVAGYKSALAMFSPLIGNISVFRFPDLEDNVRLMHSY
jgi:4'-phosphopantetheinyl transferase